jgi:hypothetical protein
MIVCPPSAIPVQEGESGDSEPNSTASYRCISTRTPQILSVIDRYIGTQLDHIVGVVARDEIPRLFAKTKNQVELVLDYFNKHVLPEGGDSRLQVVLAPTEGSFLSNGNEKTTWVGVTEEVRKLIKVAAHWEARFEGEEGVGEGHVLMEKFAKLARL